MFWIDGQAYPVESAELVAEIDAEERRISFSLYVESKESETGLSLNNISVPGTSLPGLIVRMSEDRADDFNDLSQSQVSVKGGSWRILNFFLRAGYPKDERISVELTATCAPEEAPEKTHQVKLSGDVDLSLESERI